MRLRLAPILLLLCIAFGCGFGVGCGSSEDPRLTDLRAALLETHRAYRAIDRQILDLPGPLTPADAAELEVRIAALASARASLATESERLTAYPDLVQQTDFCACQNDVYAGYEPCAADCGDAAMAAPEDATVDVKPCMARCEDALKAGLRACGRISWVVD
jgi:hypothetical protein